MAAEVGFVHWREGVQKGLPNSLAQRALIDELRGKASLVKMTETQIQLPDELFQRAMRFAAQRELSLAEITRRGLELLLAGSPETMPVDTDWKLPTIRGHVIKVPLEQLHEISAEEEEVRSVSDAFYRY